MLDPEPARSHGERSGQGDRHSRRDRDTRPGSPAVGIRSFIRRALFVPLPPPPSPSPPPLLALLSLALAGPASPARAQETWLSYVQTANSEFLFDLAFQLDREDPEELMRSVRSRLRDKDDLTCRDFGQSIYCTALRFDNFSCTGDVAVWQDGIPSPNYDYAELRFCLTPTEAFGVRFNGSQGGKFPPALVETHPEEIASLRGDSLFKVIEDPYYNDFIIFRVIWSLSGRSAENDLKELGLWKAIGPQEDSLIISGGYSTFSYPPQFLSEAACKSDI